MSKKRVRLEPQERFDLIDAHALQTLTYSYIADALGGIMGAGAGMLSRLHHTADTAAKTINFPDVFAFYQLVSKTAGNNGHTRISKGEVVVYDKTNPAQSIELIDYSAAHAAAVIHYGDAANSRATFGDAEGDFASGAFPILYARARTADIDNDARRKWSVALQTEVPVTINTRIGTYVEFAFANNLTGPAGDDGKGLWAPIAKIIGWNTTVVNNNVTAVNQPYLREISVWDNVDWHRRTKQLGDDFDGDNSIDDYWTGAESNLNASHMFHADVQYPWVSGWHYMFNGDRLRGQGLQEISLKAWLKNTDQTIEARGYVGGFGVLGNVTTGHPGFNPLTGTDRNADTGGIVDILNLTRAVIKNLANDGVQDYPSSAAERALGASTAFEPCIYLGRNSFADPYAPVLPTPAERNTWVAAAMDKLAEHGRPYADWHARPLRSVNATAIEQTVQNENIYQIDQHLKLAESKIRDLLERVTTLESERVFQDVPINNLKALVPAAVVNFVPKYGRQGAIMYRCGPPRAVREVTFVCANEVHRPQMHSMGFVRVDLNPDNLAQRGLAGDLQHGDFPITCTPHHIEGMGHWLCPSTSAMDSRVFVGTTLSATRDRDGRAITRYQQAVKDATHVRRMFSNFAQVTLNVIIRDSTSIDVHAVTTVPDLPGTPEYTRGYPHVATMQNWYFDQYFYPGNTNWWGNIGNISGGNHGHEWNQGVDANNQRRESMILHGDVTNPHVIWRGGWAGVRWRPNWQWDRPHSGATSAAATAAYPQTSWTRDGDHIHGTVALDIAAYPTTSDDLRGIAGRMTFIRPDRYSYAPAYQSANLNANAQAVVFNNAAPVPSAEAGHDTNNQSSEGFRDRDAILAAHGHGYEAGEAENWKASSHKDRCELMNGRFMPAFTLTVHAPEYATLGGVYQPSDWLNYAQHANLNGTHWIAPQIRFERTESEGPRLPSVNDPNVAVGDMPRSTFAMCFGAGGRGYGLNSDPDYWSPGRQGASTANQIGGEANQAYARAWWVEWPINAS